MQRPAADPAAAVARAGRGRPSVVDPEQVSRAALELWRDRGYAATGWRELAEATGVSVRTLMRHFGSRAAIAWIGSGPATERLREALDRIPESTPLADALRVAVVDSMSRPDWVRRLGPTWARLVVEEPELAASAHRAYQPWTDTLAGYIASRLPDAPAPVAQALAVAYRAASHAALLDAAAQDGPGGSARPGDPARAVDDVLRWLVPLTAPG